MSDLPERWRVSGMTCSACSTRLERVVRRLPGASEVRVEFATGTLTLRGRDLPEAELLAAVERAGFQATPVEAAEPPSELRALLVRVAVAAVLSMQSMMLGLALAGDGLPPHLVLPLGVAAGLTTVPAVGWAGLPLLRATLTAMRQGGLGVDGLVGIGVVLTWLASWLSLATGGTEVWFDTSAALVALHLGGRAVESGVRGRATRAVRRLLALAPERATVQRGERTEEVDVRALRVGDRVVLLPGARAPVDGRVVQGRSTVERALLHGEPLPRAVDVGGLVEAGVLNGDGALVLETLRGAGQRRIDGIVAQMERALASRPAFVSAADRVAGALVPLIGAVAVAAGLWSWWDGGGWAQALLAAATVVVVTCPCALTLAAPVALAAAAGAAATRGVVFRDADAVERLATCTEVWLDKTGTLTAGAVRVSRVTLAPEREMGEVIAAATRLASASQHPAARAVRDLSPRLPPAEARLAPGDGVEADIAGRRWRLGRAQWAAEDAPLRDGPSTTLSCDGRWVATFELDDPPRPEAEATLERLRALGLGLAVLSGDPSDAAPRLAAAWDIARVERGLSPEQKASRLQAAIGEGRRVAFVGDGVNDSIAHAASWVGVAPAGSTDVAAAAAGVTLHEDLRGLTAAIEIARATRVVVRQNLAWALVYNLLAVPLAASGGATPLIAAAAMTASSLTVTLNAARLLRLAAPERGEGTSVEGSDDVDGVVRRPVGSAACAGRGG